MGEIYTSLPRKRHDCNYRITKWIELYLSGELEDLDAHLANTLGKRFDKRVRASVDEYHGECIHPLLDTWLNQTSDLFLGVVADQRFAKRS